MRNPSRRRFEMVTQNILNESLKEMAMVSVRDLIELTNTVKTLIDEVNSLRNHVTPIKLYGNREVKEVLGIQDKLLKKYRDDGLLGFHQVGDKYWYTLEDLQNFMILCKVEPIVTPQRA